MPETIGGESSKSDVFSDVLEARKKTKKSEERDKKRKGRFFDRWPVRNSGPAFYSFTFHDVLTSQSPIADDLDSRFEQGEIGLKEYLSSYWRESKNLIYPLIALIAEKKKKMGKVRALDLMSYGAVLEKAELSGYAVALSDHRSIKKKKIDAQKGIEVGIGDIMSPKTWREVRNFLNKQGKGEKFDFVFCRPLGGLKNIPKNPGLYSWLLARSYEVLSADDGVLLTQFHEEMTPIVASACRQLKKVEEIEVRYQSSRGNCAFLLVKHPQAPDRLPKLQISEDKN